MVELHGVDIDLGGRRILTGVDLTVMRGERIGVIGGNGQGKSVLVKLLTGELEPTSGTRWIGPSIEMGLLAQDHDALPSTHDRAGSRAPGAAPARRARRCSC